MNRRHLLLGMAATPLLAQASFAAGRRDDARSIIERWARDNSFAGVISLGHAGRTTESHAFGLASIEDRTAASPSTEYAFGSVSKWFVTVAVLRLCERGVLRLDAPIGTYLPSIRGDAGTRVQLVHLLSNTRGIPDAIVEAVKTNPSLRSSTDSAASIVARYVPQDLIFTPGTKFDYAFQNWVIVRALLEQVTGRAFVDLMRELVLRPAGVEVVGIAERGFASVPGLAPAYRSTNPTTRKVDPVPAFGAASGSFYGTTIDLITAAHNVFGPRLLSPASRKALLTVRVPDETYAIGGRVHVVGGRVWTWDTGKVGGYRTHLSHNVAGDCTIALTGNTDMEQSVIGDLVNRLIGIL
jgi:CubicO group peptidase (beta-lactamase class C family)